MGIDIAGLIGGSIGESVAKVVGAFKADPTIKAQLEAAVEENDAAFKLKALELQGEVQKEISAQVLAQIAVNEADAKGNWFQSSWRPLIGYICGTGLAYQVALRPIINFVAALFGSKAVAEQLDMGTLLSLLVPMLGLGAYRTMEKLQEKD